MERKVIIYSTLATGLKSVMSSATTWGQLRSEISHLMSGDMVATVASTKNQLVSEEALLPEGEFKLVLTPAKTKSGIDTVEVMISLRDKINNAFDEIITEIENGDFDNGEENTSETLEELKKIAKNL